MNPQITGLHHVTAICADGQANIDFYTGVLGLRLVKVTVNYDDPRSYHLYYGDTLGLPGSAMTFFVWPGASRGRIGAPQVVVTSFAVPSSTMPFWRDRLTAQGVEHAAGAARFGEEVIEFADPDGMRLEIVADDGDTREPWDGGPVKRAHAIRGFHSVTLAEEGYEQTAELLTTTLGFRAAGEEGQRFRFVAGEDAGGIVDVLCVPSGPRGKFGAGVVHHVAYRTPDDAQQKTWRDMLAGHRFNVSPIMDRQYFHSIYFREPGGVLFEIATEQPGFTADESAAELGTSLKLPAQYEYARAQIEAALPALRLPGVKA